MESEVQSGFIKKLRMMFPDCMIMKNDPNYLQGVPDLTILWGPRWAALEVKDSRTARRQPNQAYYIGKMNDWSFSAFVYPDNEEEVLDALQRAFGSGRPARVPQSQRLPLDQLRCPQAY